MYLYSFEKLEVWKESMELVKSIYEMTNEFPQSEKFGLSVQLRRASVSVSSNIAEGTSRSTGKDKAHFSTLAYSSLMEVLNQLIITKELNIIGESDYIRLRKMIGKISNMLNSLRKSQLKTAIN